GVRDVGSEQPLDDGGYLRVLGAHGGTEVDALEHELTQRGHRGPRVGSLHDVARELRVLDHVVHERVYARGAVAPEHGDGLGGKLLLAQQAGADRVVDVVIDVGDAVDDAHDAPLERRGRARAARVPDDAVANGIAEVEPGAVSLEVLDDAQRMLVVAEVASEARFEAAIEDLLADVPEGRVSEVVPEADRLDEVLVERERARDGARDGGDL